MRVLIADDHAIVRKGVRSLLESHYRSLICSEAVDGADAVKQALGNKPDVVIMDITMPSLNGFEAASQIHRNFPDLPIVMLSMHQAAEHLEAAKAIGVRAYVSKSQASKDLIKAIDSVMNHQA